MLHQPAQSQQPHQPTETTTKKRSVNKTNDHNLENFFESQKITTPEITPPSTGSAEKSKDDGDNTNRSNKGIILFKSF